MSDEGKLAMVKSVHTVIWAVFAGFVVGIPVFAAMGDMRTAFIFWSVIMVESVVLAFNGWHCPITDIAARYTQDRRPNFDIYLPEWLAEHNVRIFGSLYVAGSLFAAWRMFSGR